MGLCISRSCGCAITSTEVNITGDGSPGSPWNLSGVGVGRMTEAQVAALSGPDLFEGRYVHTTDGRRLWKYTNGGWVVMDEPPQAWTPTLTQSVAITVTAAVGWYIRRGAVTDLIFSLTANSGGSAGSNISIGGVPAGLSSPTLTGSPPQGTYVYNRSGVALYGGTFDGTNFVESGAVVLGQNPNFAVVAGHALSGHFKIWRNL